MNNNQSPNPDVDRNDSSDASATRPNLTIVIPVKDEQGTIKPLYEGICKTLDALDEKFEIIFVDDGSRDDSFKEMKSLYEADPRVRIFRFYVNYGKSPALAAAFEHARGNIVVTIDSDMQDDPVEIPHLLEKLGEGYDLVSGWKKNRQDPFSKRLFSKIFNKVVSKSSGILLHDFNCGLKCFRKEVLDQVKLYGEMHRFLPVMASWYGFRIGEVEVTHHPRCCGKSKYGGERIIKGLLDFGTIMFFSNYAQSPLHLFGRIGLSLGLIGFLLLFCSLGTFLAGSTVVSGVALACGLAAALISFQCFSLGLIAEMLTFLHRRRESSYFINERLER